MKNKGGRPSLYTEEVVERICTEIMVGRSLNTICRQDDFPALPTVCTWLAAPEKYPGFLERYREARAVQAEIGSDEIRDIADDVTEDVQRSRLKVDARKWNAVKLLPKRYGDIQRVEMGGKVTLTEEDQGLC